MDPLLSVDALRRGASFTSKLSGDAYQQRRTDICYTIDKRFSDAFDMPPVITTAPDHRRRISDVSPPQKQYFDFQTAIVDWEIKISAKNSQTSDF